MEIIRFIGKFIRKLSNLFLPFIIIEKWLLFKQSKTKTNHIPIFIIGAPRSGTTIIYQYIVYYFTLAYISNIASVFYTFPVFITKAFRNKINNKRGLYKSDYGYLPGLYLPSEAAKVYEHWFDKSFNQKKQKQIKRSINAISNTFNASFVSKNLANINRLEKIKSLFPNALFIIVSRDLKYNTQSIVHGIINDNERIIMPKNSSINSNIYTQTILDIQEISNKIQDFIKRESPNTIQIDYNDFISDPYSFLVSINKTYKSITGNKLASNIEKKEIKKLKSMDRIKLSREQWDKLEEALEKINN